MALASDSRRRRPASSTSVALAPRCTTGHSPAAWVARSCCGSRTPTRPATARSGPRGSSTRWRGSGSAPTTEHFEGPYFQSEYAAEHIAAAERLFEQGDAYYCDLTAEEIQARAKELGTVRLRRAGPVTAVWAPARAGCCGSESPKAAPWSTTSFAARWCSTTRPSRTSCSSVATAPRCSCSPTSSTTSRCASATSSVPRSTSRTRRSSRCSGEALGDDPPRWAHVPVLVNEQRKKLSKRRDKVALEQYRDEGYLADAMVNYLMTLGWTPRRRGVGLGDRPWARDGGGLPSRGRHTLAGVLRPEEAGGVQRRVHPRDAGRGVRRARPVATEATRSGWDRGRLRRDGAAHPGPADHLGRGARAWSTSCSCPTAEVDYDADSWARRCRAWALPPPRRRDRARTVDWWTLVGRRGAQVGARRRSWSATA